MAIVNWWLTASGLKRILLIFSIIGAMGAALSTVAHVMEIGEPIWYASRGYVRETVGIHVSRETQQRQETVVAIQDALRSIQIATDLNRCRDVNQRIDADVVDIAKAADEIERSRRQRIMAQRERERDSLNDNLKSYGRNEGCF